MGNSTVDDFIEQANQTLSTDDLSRLFRNAIGNFGFDRFCYSLFTDHPSLGVNAGHALAGNYPGDWMAHYLANGYDKKDPVLCYGGAMSGPFTWDWLCQTRTLTPEQKKVMGEAEDAGLRDGAAVPIFGHSGELGGVGVASTLGGVKPNKVVLSKLRVPSHRVSSRLHRARRKRRRCARCGRRPGPPDRSRKGNPVMGGCREKRFRYRRHSRRLAFGDSFSYGQYF